MNGIHGNRFYKKERLCSKYDIDRLFPDTKTNPGKEHPFRAMAYPWRAVWLPSRIEAPFHRILLMVPKKRLRHAVDRVTMKRRFREAYRQLRNDFPCETAADIAFIYVASAPTPYSATQKSITRLFEAVSKSFAKDAVAKKTDC